jgi:hypothetical protein
MIPLLRIERLGGASRVITLLPFVALAATACSWTDTLLAVHDGGGTDGSVCANYQAIDAGVGTTEGLVAWYPCESAAGTSGTLLPDSTAHGNDGTLLVEADGGEGYRFAAGRVGNALDLVYANKGYVALPAGLLADACEATIATWVYINSNDDAWARIWDFGQDMNVYMFLTSITNYNQLAKFAITVSGRMDEQAIEAESAVPTLQWTHVAVVLGPSGATLYFDGEPVGTSSTVTLRPADLGSTVNNYIGRSQFSEDSYLDGNIDEFRVYGRTLSPDEIRALVNGS